MGYSSRLGLCIGLMHKDGGGTSCGGDSLPPNGSAISLNGVGFSGPSDRDAGYTEISGLLRPDVAGVKVRYRTQCKLHRIDALVVQVAGRALSQVKEPKPFGIVEFTVSGCVEASHFRAIAYDANGARIEKANRFGDLPFGCHGPGV